MFLFLERCSLVSATEQVLVKATGKQLTKQDVILADGTAACRCVLWEAHTDQLKVGDSFTFENVTIRSYNGSNYLSERKLLSILQTTMDMLLTIYAVPKLMTTAEIAMVK